MYKFLKKSKLVTFQNLINLERGNLAPKLQNFGLPQNSSSLKLGSRSVGIYLAILNVMSL